MQRVLTIAIVILLVASMAVAAPIVAPDRMALESASDYSMDRSGQTLIVIFDGKTVFERYANGGAADRRQLLASGSKSFVGVAAVAAVQDKIIQLDGSASDAIIEWKADPVKSQITYRQLLSLTSGLKPGGFGAAVHAPAWKRIIENPLTGLPGKRFEYGAYQLNAFAYALEQKLGKESFEAYLKRRILDPIGIEVEWRFRCKDGHPQVGGGAFVTARDWAKFGEFIRLGGQWGDKKILDSKILKACFKGTRQNPAYGLTWWLKQPVSNELRQQISILSRDWGDVANSTWLPKDLVAACGLGKQRLYIIPSLKLVIVRQGFPTWRFSDIEFLARLLGKKEVKLSSKAAEKRAASDICDGGR